MLIFLGYVFESDSMFKDVSQSKINLPTYVRERKRRKIKYSRESKPEPRGCYHMMQPMNKFYFASFLFLFFFNFAAHDWLENKESLNIKKKLKFVRVPNRKQ